TGSIPAPTPVGASSNSASVTVGGLASPTLAATSPTCVSRYASFSVGAAPAGARRDPAAYKSNTFAESGAESLWRATTGAVIPTNVRVVAARRVIAFTSSGTGKWVIVFVPTKRGLDSRPAVSSDLVDEWGSGLDAL